MEEKFVNGEDEYLTLRAISGCKEAFAQLYDRYYIYALMFANRLSKNEEVAKDIAQESFLRAYLGIKNLKNNRLFRNWLLGIIINVYREYIRERDNSLQSLDSIAAITGGFEFGESIISNSFPDPSALLENGEIKRLLVESLNQLPPKLKESALLFYFEGLSLKEAASLMFASSNTIKVRLYRARISLRKSISKLLNSFNKDIILI